MGDLIDLDVYREVQELKRQISELEDVVASKDAIINELEEKQTWHIMANGDLPTKHNWYRYCVVEDNVYSYGEAYWNGHRWLNNKSETKTGITAWTELPEFDY